MNPSNEHKPMKPQVRKPTINIPPVEEFPQTPPVDTLKLDAAPTRTETEAQGVSDSFATEDWATSSTDPVLRLEPESELKLDPAPVPEPVSEQQSLTAAPSVVENTPPLDIEDESPSFNTPPTLEQPVLQEKLDTTRVTKPTSPQQATPATPVVRKPASFKTAPTENNPSTPPTTTATISRHKTSNSETKPTTPTVPKNTTPTTSQMAVRKSTPTDPLSVDYIPENHPLRASHQQQGYLGNETYVGNVKKKHAKPTMGWQKWVRAIGLNVPKSKKEQAIDQLHYELNLPLEHAKTIAIVHPSGGAGATTVGLCVAGTINSTRKEEASSIIIDTSYMGDLRDRMTNKQNIHSTQEIAYDPKLEIRDHVVSLSVNNHSYALRGIGADQKPDATPITPDEYINLTSNLKKHFRFTFVDTTTVDDSALFQTIINHVDAILMVVNPTSASSKRALLFRQWLLAQEHLRPLWEHTLIVYNAQSPVDAGADTATFVNRVNQHNNILVGLPWDEHLAEGGVINHDLLHKATQHQFLKIASKLITLIPID